MTDNHRILLMILILLCVSLSVIVPFIVTDRLIESRAVSKQYWILYVSLIPITAVSVTMDPVIIIPMSGIYLVILARFLTKTGFSYNYIIPIAVLSLGSSMFIMASVAIIIYAFVFVPIDMLFFDEKKSIPN